MTLGQHPHLAHGDARSSSAIRTSASRSARAASAGSRTCSTAWTSSTRTSTSDLPLKLKPSEYWRRQCKATFQYDRVGTKLIDEMGVETLMWGSDYPHPDGVWPESEKYISEQFAHLPADVTRKMTCENAGRFYGLIK